MLAIVVVISVIVVAGFSFSYFFVTGTPSFNFKDAKDGLGSIVFTSNGKFLGEDVRRGDTVKVATPDGPLSFTVIIAKGNVLWLTSSSGNFSAKYEAVAVLDKEALSKSTAKKLNTKSRSAWKLTDIRRQTTAGNDSWYSTGKSQIHYCNTSKFNNNQWMQDFVDHDFEEICDVIDIAIFSTLLSMEDSKNIDPEPVVHTANETESYINNPKNAEDATFTEIESTRNSDYSSYSDSSDSSSSDSFSSD